MELGTRTSVKELGAIEKLPGHGRLSALNPTVAFRKHGIDGTTLVACLSYRRNVFSFPELSLRIFFRALKDTCERMDVRFVRELPTIFCRVQRLLATERELSTFMRSAYLTSVQSTDFRRAFGSLRAGL